MWSHRVKLIMVCTMVLVHPTICGKCRSCNCPPNEQPSRRQDSSGIVDIEQLSPHEKAEVKTEPPKKLAANPKKKGCCPYDFDGTNCRTVQDRILCGYNKNAAGLTMQEIQKDLSGGCKLRYGRIECGYWVPPYANQRRPPGWDNPPAVILSAPDYVDRGLPNKLVFKERSPVAHTIQPVTRNHWKRVTRFFNALESDNINSLRNGENEDKSEAVKAPLRHAGGNQVSCVEIDDRIVCKPIGYA